MAFTFSFGGPAMSGTVDAENRVSAHELAAERQAELEARAHLEEALGAPADADEPVGECLGPCDAERSELLRDNVLHALAENRLAVEGVRFGTDRGRMLRKVGAVHHLLDEVSLENEALAGIVERSDLAPGVYEGGFKLWEGALDLLGYVDQTGSALPVVGGRVLELGCGHGLPGIWALQAGAHSVVFTDFNRDVLRFVTLPNVWLNCGLSAAQERALQPATEPASSGDARDDLIWADAASLPLSSAMMDRAQFWSGDWAALDQLMPADRQFELILSSETIYNTSTYEALYGFISGRLSRDHAQACALIATKDHYFGVGGGLIDFSQFVSSRGPDALKLTVVARPETGRNTIARSIIKLSWH